MILEGFSLIFHRKQISTYKLILVDPVKHEKKKSGTSDPEKSAGEGDIRVRPVNTVNLFRPCHF